MGIKAILSTGQEDSVETLRAVKTLSFVINADVPTDKGNLINPKNLPILKDGDEFSFGVYSVEDYDSLVKYLKGRLISFPTIIMTLHKRLRDNKEFMAKLLADASKFSFKLRVF